MSPTPVSPNTVSPTLVFSAAALVLVVLTVSCGIGDGGPTARPVPEPTAADGPGSHVVTPETSRPPSSTGPTNTRAATSAAAEVGGGDQACEVLARSSPGDVERFDLIETSGLVASDRHQGVLWATNDSGQRSGLHAVGRDGVDLGFFELVLDGQPVSTTDVEDLARAGDAIYLADIGDNGARRATVAVHEVAEPEPGADGPGVDGRVELARTIELRYPDGPTDAEALIVDPERQELIILSKDLDEPSAPTRLYRAPLGPEVGSTVEATLAGELDVAALTASSTRFSLSTLLFPGAVTAADLSPAGDLIAIRTYGSVWLFPREPGQSVTEALLSVVPCEAAPAAESQGEAVAFVDPSAVDGANRAAVDGTGPNLERRVVALATISEGQNPPINHTLALLSP